MHGILRTRRRVNRLRATRGRTADAQAFAPSRISYWLHSSQTPIRPFRWLTSSHLTLPESGFTHYAFSAEYHPRSLVEFYWLLAGGLSFSIACSTGRVVKGEDQHTGENRRCTVSDRPGVVSVQGRRQHHAGRNVFVKLFSGHQGRRADRYRLRQCPGRRSLAVRPGVTRASTVSRAVRPRPVPDRCSVISPVESSSVPWRGFPASPA
jgi:hypothetical protein